MSKDGSLTSRQAGELLNVGTSTINRWADAGLIPHLKTPGGHRRFRERELLAFRKAGSGERAPWPDHYADLSRWWHLLTGDSNAGTVAGKLLSQRGQLGSWWRVADRLGPLIQHIGELWENGVISTLEEHIATERLARAITRCSEAIPLDPAAPVCLLATAPGDEHTLGLNLVELCLAEAGWRSAWSGRQSPYEALVHEARHGNWDMLAISASTFSSDPGELERFAHELGEASRQSGTRLILGGQGAWPNAAGPWERVLGFFDLRQMLTP